jgi:hypothetical protein
MTGPRVLAGFVQSTLDALAGLGPGAAARVRARMAPASLAAVAEASRIAWVPLALDIELTNWLYAEVGMERGRAFMRDNLRKSFDLPILRGLLDTALRLLGRDPERVLRWAPKVWGHLFRGAGSLRFEEAGACAARLVLADLPDEVLRGSEWLDGTAGAAAAVFDILRVDGEVRLEGPDRSARTAAIHATWKGVE